MSTAQQYKAKYLLRVLRKDWNPFTPDSLFIDDHMIKHRRRNWHLISCDTQTYHFQNVIGIDIDKALFGANIVIQTTGAGRITVRGFSKRAANQIVSFCSQHIVRNTQRSTVESLTGAITQAINGTRNSNHSVADELVKLKGLLDSGVLDQAEFAEEKKRILGR